MKNVKSFQMRTVLFALFALFSAAMFAQITITGTVYDDMGEATGGAAIREKGTSNGTASDVNGKYTLQVSKSSAVLQVSFMGFQTQEIKVNGRKVININLVPDSKLLNEVVTIGYGTMKKSDIAGSVTSVNTEEMMRRAPINLADGLKGAAAGVLVSSNDGSPDGNANIRIRGVGTLNGNAKPLWVVDGIQVGTDANFLNPADIESIEVLKDASATAIYGSAGANGVIMVTTKHGDKGHSVVNFTANFGIQTLGNSLDVCDVDGYARNIRQIWENDGTRWNDVWDEKYDGKRKYTDWQDKMTRAALRQNYNISASGGNDKTQYNYSLGFLRNEGIIVNSQYQRLNARANVKTQINKWLEFGGDISYVHSDSHGSNSKTGNFGNASSLRDLAVMCPTMDFVTRSDATYDGVPAGTYVSPNVVNPDGTFGEVLCGKDVNEGFLGSTMGNLYAKQMELNSRNRVNRTLASAYMNIQLAKGLSFKTLASYNYLSGSNNNFSGGIKRVNYVNGQAIDVTQGGNAYVNPGDDNHYKFGVGNWENQTLSIDNTLTYQFKNDIHDLTFMLGNEVTRYYGQSVSANAEHFWSKDVRDTSLGLLPAKKSGNGSLNLESRGISYFGRVAYSLLNRYIVTATLRRDGSSNFGAGNRWGTFPSAAVAWRVSEESFMQNQNVVDNLKLRFGWGQTGNSGGATDRSVPGLILDPATKYTLYSAGSGMGQWNAFGFNTGYFLGLVDTNLKWETNEQFNIGLDATLLNGDINLTVDYFVRNTKDLLVNREVRPSTGFSSVYTNYGNIRNSGLEVSLGYNKRINKDWSINATLTGSTLRNRVTKLDNPLFGTNSSSAGGYNDEGNTMAVGASDGYHWGDHSISREGSAVGSFYGYRVQGVIKTQEDLDYVHNRPVYNEKGEQVGTFDSQPEAQLGDYMFKDLNKDGNIDEKDRDILGHGFPSVNYGLNLGANYKNWDFSIYMYGVLGQDILSYSAMRLTNVFASDDGFTPNILKSAAAQAWSVDNPNGNVARLTRLDKNLNMRCSDAWVKNGNFLKISNIQVGYTIPRDFLDKIGIQGARVYASVQNLLTFSPYNKYGDPEVGIRDVLFTGLDTGRYPSPRTYQLGVSVQF
ncbi:MAG: TonB-dependent receptor [Prevotellaceae bacterium]|nr:TonB-dependent receptor [Candidatus Minthosoma caballi]